MPLYCVWVNMWGKKILYKFQASKKMINSKEVEILGIKTDQILSFHQHIKSISKKASQKLSALLRISPHFNITERKLFIIQ